MPPNRKAAHVLIADGPSPSAADLLVHQPSTENVAKVQSPTLADAGYWDWPADKEVQSLQQCEVEAARRVSAAHIESNLVSEASRRQNESVQMETLESSADETSDNQQDYWYMPAFPKPRKQMNDVVKEEAKSVIVVNTDEADIDASKDYWNWPTSRGTGSTERDRLIRQILEEETARQLLSIEHIEANLCAAASSLSCKNERLTSSISSDEYWSCPS